MSSVYFQSNVNSTALYITSSSCSKRTFPSLAKILKFASSLIFVTLSPNVQGSSSYTGYYKGNASVYKVICKADYSASIIRNQSSLCNFTASSSDFSTTPFQFLGELCYTETWNGAKSLIELHGYNTTNDQTKCVVNEIRSLVCPPYEFKISKKAQIIIFSFLACSLACFFSVVCCDRKESSTTNRGGYIEL